MAKNMKIKMVVLASIIVLFTLICKYDVQYQVANFENKINALSITEIEKQYGTELSNLYHLVETQGYSEPNYTYVKLQNELYLINITSILYGKNGDVLDSKDVYLEVTFK